MAWHLFSAKPLSEPILDYYWLDNWDKISVKFESQYNSFHWRKCISKWWIFCLCINVVHIVAWTRWLTLLQKTFLSFMKIIVCWLHFTIQWKSLYFDPHFTDFCWGWTGVNEVVNPKIFCFSVYLSFGFSIYLSFCFSVYLPFSSSVYLQCSPHKLWVVDVCHSVTKLLETDLVIEHQSKLT